MKTQAINLEIPQAHHDQLLRMSMKREDGRRVSMSEHIRRAIQEYIERESK